MTSGPLRGLRVLEFAGIGPAPFCGMLLSDLGADVLRIDRKTTGSAGIIGAMAGGPAAVTERGRRSIAMDLKQPSAIAACLKLMAKADALIEGFRPGVMERLGMGPDVVLARHPRLVFGRMTGWGQTGPLSQAAGHDINYIAISGALSAIGPSERPVPPLNLIGDFGGGALYLAFGLLAGIIHARATGVGQVVDCAITDGAASLLAMQYGMLAKGLWADERESNILDGGAHFYGTYQCADGKWISVGSIEPQFYNQLLQGLGMDPAELPPQDDQLAWPALRQRIAKIFLARSQADWCAAMEGTDVCFAPVLDMAEAPNHPHNVARSTFIERDGVIQPAPAPRFSATPASVQRSPPESGEHTEEALLEWGFNGSEISALGRESAI